MERDGVNSENTLIILDFLNNLKTIFLIFEGFYITIKWYDSISTVFADIMICTYQIGFFFDYFFIINHA